VASPPSGCPEGNDDPAALGEALRNVHSAGCSDVCSVFLISLQAAREGVVGIRQAGLELTDDRAEKA